MERSRVAVVIPTLNEAPTIAHVVAAASRYGMVVVVDDGSTDDSASLAQEAGAEVVQHKGNMGYDAALNSGFRRAVTLGAQVIVTLDGDAQHNPSLIETFVAAIDSGAEVVVGFRARPQRIAEYLFARFSAFRWGVKDPLCGMKAYSASVYMALGHFDSYGSVGTELLLFALTHRYRVEQVECSARERKGTPRFGRALIGNYRILRAMLYAFVK